MRRLSRAPVLPAGGRVADGVGHVAAAQHLHVPAAQETPKHKDTQRQQNTQSIIMYYCVYMNVVSFL